MVMTKFPVELVIKEPVLRVDVVQHPPSVHGGGGCEQDQLELARGVAVTELYFIFKFKFEVRSGPLMF